MLSPLVAPLLFFFPGVVGVEIDADDSEGRGKPEVPYGGDYEGTSETWQRSGSARGVESSSRPAGRRFASDDVREGSARRAAERRAIDGVTYRAIPSRSESV